MSSSIERHWGPVTYGTAPGGKVRHMIWGAGTGKCGGDASGPDNPALRVCQRCLQSYTALGRRTTGRRYL